MIRAHDVTGHTDDDPIVWEVRAERWHASILWQRHEVLRASDVARLGEGLAAEQARIVAAVTEWQQTTEFVVDAPLAVTHQEALPAAAPDAPSQVLDEGGAHECDE